MSQSREAARNPARGPRVAFICTPPDERPALLRRLIVEHLRVILRRTVNPDRSFFDYGLDSLGTLQLLVALEADTGIRLRAVDVTTVRALADMLSVAMQELQPAGGDARG
jgi:polyketide synthase 5